MLGEIGSFLGEFIPRGDPKSVDSGICMARLSVVEFYLAEFN